MKITIDTKEDSHDDLRKVIRMLQHMVGESNDGAILSNSSSGPSEESTGAFFNMFGDSPSSPSIDEDSSDDDDQEEEKEDEPIPEIIPY